ncbi:MAG: S8 family serine peptidase [Sedimentisphaerales bacterium]|nr:S8 family serine peptidase [Sedimentisphaerales bacterium]
MEITTGDPNIIVAVIDIGVESNHPDLVGNLVPGYDFFDGDNQPDPVYGHEYNGHGTCCAGLIAARGNNEIGVSGVTWNCKVMPVRTHQADAEGVWHLITESAIATAFRWAASNDADILSNSWALANPRPILHSAIMDITKDGGIGRGGKGCVVLFAAGNDSKPISVYPQKYYEVIVVGATDHNDVRWSYMRLCILICWIY